MLFVADSHKARNITLIHVVDSCEVVLLSSLLQSMNAHINQCHLFPRFDLDDSKCATFVNCLLPGARCFGNSELLSVIKMDKYCYPCDIGVPRDGHLWQ